MRIDVLCSDGSPLGIHYNDIFGENGRVGLGGAELALMTVLEGWTKQGHEVVLYNNPVRKDDSPFEQRYISTFDKNENRDVLVVFRSPNQKAMDAKGYKVWWSCDQKTIGDFANFAQFADKIVTISPYHSEYFSANYNIKDAIHIDIPVRHWEYDEPEEKIPNRLIFTSVPDRGLAIVAKTFPAIKQIVPDASIVITSDYRLWGAVSPLNQTYADSFRGMDGVVFLGAVTRERLIKEQLKAQIHYYPCLYEELFCIAVAESQVAGVLPITTSKGSLMTTNMGVIIDGDAGHPEVQRLFVETTVEYLQNPELPVMQKYLQDKSKERFSLDRVLKEWDEKVFVDC